ncbi:hypothetical protein GCM10009087_00410 [Sphingomonas oligophenolica]
MPEAFLHRQQDVGIAARLDMDYTIGVEARQVERGREQVAPAETPEDRTFDPRKDASEKDRRAGVVRQIGAAGYLMQRTDGDSPAGQAEVELVYPEGNRSMTNAHALDPRDLRS